MHAIDRYSPQARLARGFTLIELMIVVTVIAIISAIGYPAYTNHVRKGHRAAVQSHMMSMASRQGEILADSRSYAAQAEILGLLPTPAGIAKYYTITVALGTTPPSFTITATPVTTSSQKNDGTLTLKSNGERSPEAKW